MSSVRASTARTFLVLGVTYKRDTNDLRESPALDIMKILQGKGATVSFYDSYVADLSSLDGAHACST